MDLFLTALVSAVLLCSLTAGFLFAFAIVVMPGLKRLGDREFLGAFRAIDRIIQKGQPIFMIVWIGSIVAVITAAATGFGLLEAGGRLITISAVVTYLLGVQLPTAVVNVPLNNELQSLDVSTAGHEELQTARDRFEQRWNRWNVFRTVCAMITSFLLIILLRNL